MKIKTFEGQSMAEVLKKIKADLGEEAVILSTKELEKKISLPDGRFRKVSVVQMSAAIDHEEMHPEKNQSGTESSAAFDETLTRAIQGDLYKELQEIKTSLKTLKTTPVSGGSNSSAASAPEEKEELEIQQKKLQETWLEMKIMLKSLNDLKNTAQGKTQHRVLIRLHDQLIESGVDTETAEHLVRAVTEELPKVELWRPDRVQSSIQKIIEGLVQVSGPLNVDENTCPDGPKIVALIGPTGVGKTTTIAKLGVDWKKREKPVTLVSLFDPHQVDADPLMHYADHHGLAMVRVSSWKGLEKWVTRRKKGELVLVDTSGRSHLNSKDVSVLKGLVSMGMPLETHLVLSANIKGGDLSDMIDRFSVVPIDSLLFTKMDETKTYGPLLSAMGRKRKPISYLTTGRRVPEDIEVATPKRLTDLMLKSALERV